MKITIVIKYNKIITKSSKLPIAPNRGTYSYLLYRNTYYIIVNK